MVWFSLIVFAVLTVALELLRPTPKLENAKPAGLGDFNFPTATEGRKMPLLWGTVRVEGPNVIWYGDLTQDPIYQTVRVSLFKKKTYIKGYRYYVGMQFALCREEIDGIRRWWLDDKLLFDGTSSLAAHGDTMTIDDDDLQGGDDLGQGGFTGTLEVFAGTASQAASTYLSSFQDEGGTTPAYRKVAYLAPDTEALYVGNSTSLKPQKFEAQRIATSDANGLSLADPTVNALDCNPANVIYEVLTNGEWGRNIPSSDIYTTSFTDAAATLKAEGNGFSFLLDNPEKVEDMLERVLAQIDAVLYQRQSDGKWVLSLVRSDYTTASLPVWDDATIVEVQEWVLGTWEQTTNNVTLRFNDRDDDYKVTFASAQDMANMRIRDGEVVATEINHPGCMDPTLANALVWRDLRGLSTPLIQGKVVTDRSTYGTVPGDAVKLSFTRGGLTVTERIVRIRNVDLGELLDGKITYTFVEDVFRSEAGSFDDPASTGWEAPSDSLTAFPTDEQLALEAPRGLMVRDPEITDPDADLIIFAARRQTTEVFVDAWTREASGTPSGNYSEAGTAAGLMRIGSLDGALAAGDSVPTSAITIESSPDLQALILGEFTAAAPGGANDLEDNLTTLILIDDEFMLPTTASAATGTDIDLEDVYRGVLDSVQADHSDGADVYLLFAGLGVTTFPQTQGYNVDVKLLPRGPFGVLDIASATAISLTMQNRSRRPYAPSRVSLGGSFWATTIGLESGGITEADGFVVGWTRRDFESLREVSMLTVDASSTSPNFPDKYTHETEIEVINDPDGAATSLYTETVMSSDGPSADGSDVELRRLDILKATDGVLPTRLRLSISGKHTYEGTEHTSLYPLVWDFDLTSTLTGYQELGAIDSGEASASFTCDTTGNHTIALTTIWTTGIVEYRVDTGGGFGSWATLISAGAKSAVVAFNSGDLVQLRHSISDTGAQKLVVILSAGATAFGVVYN